MFSTILKSFFAKHKTKIFIALGLIIAIVVITTVAKKNKAIA